MKKCIFVTAFALVFGLPTRGSAQPSDSWDTPRKRSNLSIGIFAAKPVAGTATVERTGSCSDARSGCPAENTRVSGADDSGPAFSLEALGRLPSVFRLGGAVGFLPRPRVSLDGPVRLGTELTLTPTLEARIPVGDRVNLHARGLGGLLLLWPAGALDERVRTLQSRCVPGSPCEVSDGVRGGYVYGVGAGVSVVATGGLRVRADVEARWFHFEDASATLTHDGYTERDQGNVSGSRYLLRLGVELDL